MDPLQAVLNPMTEIGTDISASVYKLPAGLKPEIVMGVVSQEPRMKQLLNARQAKITGAGSPGGESLIGIGGHVPAEVFEHIHSAVMSMDNVEFIVGAGPGCATLPPTSFGRAAAGAHARSMAPSKPWWKFW